MQPKITFARIELDNGVELEIDAIAQVSAGPIVEMLMGCVPETREQRDVGDENDYEVESRTPIDFGDATKHLNSIHVRAHRFSESPACSLDKGKLGKPGVHIVGRCIR